VSQTHILASQEHMPVTATGTLALYTVVIQALEHQGVFAIGEAMRTLYSLHGDMCGNLRLECEWVGQGYKVTLWSAP